MSTGITLVFSVEVWGFLDPRCDHLRICEQIGKRGGRSRSFRFRRPVQRLVSDPAPAFSTCRQRSVFNPTLQQPLAGGPWDALIESFTSRPQKKKTAQCSCDVVAAVPDYVQLFKNYIELPDVPRVPDSCASTWGHTTPRRPISPNSTSLRIGTASRSPRR